MRQIAGAISWSLLTFPAGPFAALILVSVFVRRMQNYGNDFPAALLAVRNASRDLTKLVKQLIQREISGLTCLLTAPRAAMGLTTRLEERTLAAECEEESNSKLQAGKRSRNKWQKSEFER